MTNFTAGPPVYWLALAIGLFCVKQFLADFVLQNRWMIRGKEAEQNWLLPLASHAGVHAVLTGLIFLTLSPQNTIIAALADWLMHGVIDRAKAVATRKLRVNQSNPVFWWLFGGDQLLHHLTHLVFSVLILSTP